MPDFPPSLWFGLARQLTQWVYDQGFQEGQNDVQKGQDDALRNLVRLLRAQEPPDSDLATGTSRVSTRDIAARTGRAPRGTVGETITKVLTRTPGQTQREIEMAMQDEDDISVTPIGNELRRNEGTRYVKDEHRRWFAIRTDQHSSSDRPRHLGHASDPASESISDRVVEEIKPAIAAMLRDIDMATRGRAKESSARNAPAGTGDDDP